MKPLRTSKDKKSVTAPTNHTTVKAVHTAEMTATMRMKRMRGRSRAGLGRIVGPALLLLAVLALDWGAFGPFSLFGVRPHVLLVFACVVAVQGGVFTGMLIGAVSGLLVDFGGGHLIGLSVVGYASAAAVAGAFSARLFSERWVIVLTAVALGTAIEQVLYIAGAHAFGHPLPPLRLLTRVLPLLLVYHALLTPFLFPLGRWLARTVAADSTEA